MEPISADSIGWRMWAAGLFEGEGCLNDFPRRNKRGLQMRLAMSDRDVVERFVQIVGAGSVHPRIHRSTPQRDRSHYKPMFEWYIYEAVEVRRVINLLLPWLGDRRSARAVEILRIAEGVPVHFGKRTHCPQGHPYAGDNLQLEHRKKYIARVCRICKTKQTRDRMRRRKGITPDRFRVKE